MSSQTEIEQNEPHVDDVIFFCIHLDPNSDSIPRFFISAVTPPPPFKEFAYESEPHFVYRNTLFLPYNSINDPRSTFRPSICNFINKIIAAPSYGRFATCATFFSKNMPK